MSFSINIPAAPALTAQKLCVFIPEGNVSADETKVILASWLSSFREKAKDIDIATAKLMTIIVIAIPELLKYLLANKGELTVRSIPVKTYVDALVAKKHPGGLDDEDWAMDSIDSDCITVTDERAIYSAAAVSFMTYAKQAGAGAKGALESARPGSLIGKYGLGDDVLGLFPGGEYGPDVDALDQANAGFSLHSNLRYQITAFFIAVRRQHGQVPPSLDPFMVMFDMLKMTGMTHVGAITMLVEMHPWTLRIPELVPYFRKFSADLKKLNLLDEDVRLYHRLLVNQSDFLFIASDLRPLIAVAGDFVKEVESSFNGYVYNASKYTDLINKVRSMNPHVTGNPDVTALAKLFNVPDIEPRAIQVFTPQSSSGPAV